MASTKRRRESESKGTERRKGEVPAIEIVTEWQSSETAQVCLQLKRSWGVVNTVQIKCITANKHIF